MLIQFLHICVSTSDRTGNKSILLILCIKKNHNCHCYHKQETRMIFQKDRFNPQSFLLLEQSDQVRCCHVNCKSVNAQFLGNFRLLKSQIALNFLGQGLKSNKVDFSVVLLSYFAKGSYSILLTKIEKKGFSLKIEVS